MHQTMLLFLILYEYQIMFNACLYLLQLLWYTYIHKIWYLVVRDIPKIMVEHDTPGRKFKVAE